MQTRQIGYLKVAVVGADGGGLHLRDAGIGHGGHLDVRVGGFGAADQIGGNEGSDDVVLGLAKRPIPDGAYAHRPRAQQCPVEAKGKEPLLVVNELHVAHFVGI